MGPLRLTPLVSGPLVRGARPRHMARRVHKKNNASPGVSMRKPVLFVVVRKTFAEAILDGKKQFELRVLPVNPEIRYVILYTPEDRAIIGGFVPTQVHRLAKKKLWEIVKGGGTPKSRFDRYFSEAHQATAIEIGARERYKSPLSLAAIRRIEHDFWIPMSFTYVGLDNPVIQSVAQQTPRLRAIMREPHEDTFDLREEAIHITPANEGDWAVFARLCQYHIAPSYDEIDESFAEAIWRSHTEGVDPVGYFTKNKKVHRIELGPERTHAGYTVTTYKRGGSVKFGPTFLFDDFQGRGIAPRVRSHMDDELRRRGYRKAYCTIPATHKRAFGYLLKAGYRVEAHLRSHYAEDHDELVWGKILTHTPARTRRELRARYQGKPKMAEQTPELGELWGLISNTMRHDYDGIDRSFAQSIVDAAHRYRGGDYSSKAKRVFTLRLDGELRGLAVCTPKRGGAVKIAPLLCPFGEDTTGEFIEFISRRLTKPAPPSKTYALIPLRDLASQAALRQQGFVPEGCLAEPYKAGADIRIMSRMEGNNGQA